MTRHTFASPKPAPPLGKPALVIRCVIAAVIAASPGAAGACTTHGLVHADDISNFFLPHDPFDPGFTHVWVGIPDSVQSPDAPTVCFVAIGIGDAATAFEYDVLDARIAIHDFHQSATDTFVSMLFSPVAGAAGPLAAGAGPGAPADRNPLAAGAAWFGFAAAVEPFTPPTLTADQQIQLQFLLRIPTAALPVALPIQFAAGKGDEAGLPMFGGDHAVRYFTADDHRVLLVAPVPEPAAASLVLLALTSLILRRQCARRSRKRGDSTFGGAAG